MPSYNDIQPHFTGAQLFMGGGAAPSAPSWLREKLMYVHHGVRHGQKSGRANTEYIVYKNYNSL